MADIPLSKKWGFFPIQDMEAFSFYKMQQKALWNPNDVNFANDFIAFNQLSKDQQQPLIKALTIFQTLDGGVIDCFVQKLLNKAKTNEEKAPYVIQLYTEMVHSESYGLQLKVLIPNDFERQKVLQEADTEPWIQNYRYFMEKYTNDDVPEILTLATQSALEGVGFSGLFSIVFWYKTNPFAKDIPGTTTSNEYIASEEGMHRDYAVFRFKRLRGQYPNLEELEMKVKSIFQEMIEVIKESIPVLLPVDLPD